MNKLALLFALLGLMAVSALASHDAHRSLFASWKAQHGKKYAHAQEEAHRFGVWAKNLAYIAEHNAAFEKGEHTYDLKMNVFGDLTHAEFKAMHLTPGVGAVVAQADKEFTPRVSKMFLPTSWDWTAQTCGSGKCVTPVKDQGQCGSCWTFSTTGAIEAAHAIATSSLVSLSEQQIVDCFKSEYSDGCNGGYPWAAMGYVIQQGLELESTYPYKAVDGTCKYSASSVAVHISGYKNVTSGDESAMAAAVYEQPVSIAIDASHMSFQFYSSGVYYEKACKNGIDDLDHAVLNVGYGTLNSQNYWKVKNSWGATWGLDGYILMSKDRSNNCGIATCGAIPVA